MCSVYFQEWNGKVSRSDFTGPFQLLRYLDTKKNAFLKEDFNNNKRLLGSL